MTSRPSSAVRAVLLLLLGSCAPAADEEGFVATHDGYKLYYHKVGNGPDAALIPIGLFTFDGLRTLARSNRTLLFYDPRNAGDPRPLPISPRSRSRTTCATWKCCASTSTSTA